MTALIFHFLFLELFLFFVFESFVFIFEAVSSVPRKSCKKSMRLAAAPVRLFVTFADASLNVTDEALSILDAIEGVNASLPSTPRFLFILDRSQ